MKTQFRVHVLLVALMLAAAAAPTTAEDLPSGTETAAPAPADGVVAYYFHGNLRCASCRKLEAWSEEAVTQGFAEELASGRLEWRVVNTDEPDNAHFVKDFELVTKSVVLVAYRDGAVVRHQNLTQVWQLLRDKEAFLGYVRDSTREFLGKT